MLSLRCNLRYFTMSKTISTQHKPLKYPNLTSQLHKINQIPGAKTRKAGNRVDRPTGNQNNRG